MPQDRSRDFLAALGAFSATVCIGHACYKLWKREETQILRNEIVELKRKFTKKPVRIYMDGCFDMMHFGHANALRQAKMVGDVLVVGLISDEEVKRNKGSLPLMPFAERAIALKACKWVDEVIENVPYDLTNDFCEKLFKIHDIDFIVHGDDPCYSVDGKDAYAYAKSKGKFRMIKRTEGISTTDIIGRMLRHTKEHHLVNDTALSHFLPTSRRINQFANAKGPSIGQKIVYISGAFDLFNAGHIEGLRKAKEFGDYLIVGIHDDNTVHKRRGDCYPVMNLHERVLSVLACRYADEVIIGAPWATTADLITSMNISVVVHGTVDDSRKSFSDEESVKAYEIPRQLGILKGFESPMKLTVKDIITRVLENEESLSNKYKKKSQLAKDYYLQKKYVPEL